MCKPPSNQLTVAPALSLPGHLNRVILVVHPGIHGKLRDRDERSRRRIRVSLEPKALQFDKAVPAATASDLAAPQGVTCVDCKQTIADEYFDINGDAVCDHCRKQIVDQLATPAGLGVFGRAGLYGVAAAIAGAILYYAVIAITDFEIGLVAIAIGYMVGWGVQKATGGRGGRRFQVLAVVLTYWAVGLAYTPFAFRGMATEAQTQQASATATPDASTPAAAEPAPPESADEPMTASQFVLAIVFMFVLSFALPVLSVMSSLPGGLISAAIIAFGMHQAWRMTGVPQLAISGPYRIASKIAS
jgi:hypothetical protein